MNTRQIRFTELVAQGRPAGRAYEEAGYDAKGNVADSCAEKLMRKAEVNEYMAKLREEAREISQFSTKSKLDTLFRIAIANEANDPRITIAAIAEENKMTGAYSPNKVDVNQDIVITIGSNSD